MTAPASPVDFPVISAAGTPATAITEPTAPAAPRPSGWRRFLMFPVTRIVLAILVILAAIAPLPPLGRRLLPLVHLKPPWIGLTVGLVQAGLALLVYAAFVRLIERRRATELNTSSIDAQFSLGTIVGLGL